MRCQSCGKQVTNNESAYVRLVCKDETFIMFTLCVECEKTLSIVFDKHAKVEK
jgi:hypothetical protein